MPSVNYRRELARSIYYCIAGMPTIGSRRLRAVYRCIAQGARLPTGDSSPRTLAEQIAAFERGLLQDELATSRTHVEVARRLGVDTATLWRKRKHYGLAGWCRCG